MKNNKIIVLTAPNVQKLQAQTGKDAKRCLAISTRQNQKHNGGTK